MKGIVRFLKQHKTVILCLVLVTLAMLTHPAVARADDDDNRGFFSNFFGPSGFLPSFAGGSGVFAIVVAIIQLVLAIISLNQGR